MIGIQTLRELPPFGGIDETALAVLAAGSRIRSYEPGQGLWLAGEASHGLFVLLDGCIRILRLKGGRQSVVHLVEERGATLGEVPLFDGLGYPASAVAATRVRCLVIGAETLRRAVRADPSLAEHFLVRLSRRVRELVERVELMTVDTVQARLASWLLASCRREGDRWIARYRSQQQLAEDLGTVREVVARRLSDLRERGYTTSSGRGLIELLDLEALRSVAEKEPGDEA